MLSDERLCENIRAGDMAAFDALYERYERNLFGFIYRYVGNPQDAEEIFHEAFMALLKFPPENFDRGNFRSWLYQVARNFSLNRRRSRTREQGAKSRLEAERGGELFYPAEFSTSHPHQALAGAVGRLPNALAEVYGLRASGLRYEEMAQVLGIPLGTVRSRVHQMVKRLKKEMQSWTAA
jgi:RNA polymerase sigma-70 factor, ECF subfamily